MRLGIKYSVTLSGADREAFTINGGNWLTAVGDMRNEWLKYKVDIVKFGSIAMTFVRDGVVLAFVQNTPVERVDDNTATWVFIPSKVIIGINEIRQVINAVRDIYRTPDFITEETFRNNPVLSLDYPERPFAPAAWDASGDQYAYRVENADFTIADILSLPFQEYYKPYRFIFLYTDAANAPAGLTNLSNKPLEEKICVLPPSAASIFAAFKTQNVTLRFDDNSVFSSVVSKHKGEKFFLTAERSGYAPVRILAEALEDGAEAQLTSMGGGWNRKITQLDFNVTDDKSGRVINLDKITINDPNYDAHSGTVAESRLGNLKVRLEAYGYNPYEGTVNLQNGPATIKMSKKIDKHVLKYRAQNGEDLDVTIEGPRVNKGAPLQGYYVQGKTLYYQGDNYEAAYKKNSEEGGSSAAFAWKEFVFGVLAALVIGAAAWGVCWFFGKDKDKKEQTEQTSQQPESHVGQTADNSKAQEQADKERAEAAAKEAALKQLYSNENAIKYLDNNKVWTKDSLDKYPLLGGLYDALNTMDREALSVNWKANLGQSAKFETIAVVTAKSLKNNWNVKAGNHNPTYNSGDVQTINVDEYWNWMSVDHPAGKRVDAGNADAKNSVNKDKSKKTPQNGKAPGKQQSKGKNDVDRGQDL